MNWQPIETAPKDGTYILVYGGRWFGEATGYNVFGSESQYHHVSYADGVWAVTDCDYYAAEIQNPTHWMPLPEPPQEGE